MGQLSSRCCPSFTRAHDRSRSHSGAVSFTRPMKSDTPFLDQFSETPPRIATATPVAPAAPLPPVDPRVRMHFVCSSHHCFRISYLVLGPTLTDD
jgi:hypothetical protein